MTEKEIKLMFAKRYIPNLQTLFKVKNLRLYMLEFPVRTPDGTKFIDMVLEDDINKCSMNNQMMVLEWKKDKIDTGAVEQVLRYSTYIQKQLYRKKKVTSFIVGADFSKWEIEMAKNNRVFCIRYDLRGNVSLVG